MQIYNNSYLDINVNNYIKIIPYIIIHQKKVCPKTSLCSPTATSASLVTSQPDTPRQVLQGSTEVHPNTPGRF